MASAGLGVAGFALFGPIGGLVGGLIGAYIDQQLFFKPETQGSEGPRIDELQLQSGSEGSNVHWPLGSRTRVPAGVLWQSPLITEESKEDVGGKGGGGEQEVTTYHHYCHALLEVCDNRDVDSADPVTRIRANGKTFWKPTTTTSRTGSSNLDVTVETEKRIGSDIKHMVVESPNGGPDLSTFTPGIDITCSAFVQANNNGTFVCEWTETEGTGETRVIMRNDSAVAESNASATLSQIQTNFDPTQVADVRILKGGATQAPDSKLEEYVSPAPAYRDKITIFLEKLYLGAFFNAFPQFSIHIEATSSESAGGAISKICARNGLAASDIDVSRVESVVNDEFLGMNASGVVDAIDICRPIMMSQNIAVRESGGQLIFYKRGEDEDTVTIAAGDLAAREEGAEVPQVIMINDPATLDMPTDLVARFVDASRRLERGSQRARLKVGPNRKTMTLDIPVTIQPEDAVDVAKRVGWSVRAERQKPVRISLPPSYVEVEEGDKLTVTAEGETFTVIAKRIDEAAAHWLRAVEGFIESSATQSFTDGSADDPPDYDEDVIYVPPAPQFQMIDLHPYQDEQAESLGIYLLAYNMSRDALWKGAVLYESVDGTNFDLLAPVPFEATAGYCLTALGDISADYWDEVSTVRVRLAHGELESKTELQVLGGANHALIGNEVIGFKTASLVDTGVYDLSGFIRGRRDTRDQTGSHAVGDRFVLIEPLTFHFREFTRSQIGTTRYYKVVPIGGVPGDYTAESGTIRGYTARTFSPGGITSTVDKDSGSGTYQDITVDWFRRTRKRWKFFDFGVSPPLVEGIERYRVQVMDGAAVKNSYIVNDATAWTYTQSAQVADWTSVQASYTIRIAQWSETIGYGKTREAIITGSP
jgi:hypothetical protein